MTIFTLLFMTSIVMTSLHCVVQAVKIQSFNAGLLVQIDNYEERKSHIIRSLKSADYDVMCLQEVWYGNDLARLKNEIEKSVSIYSPPLFQEWMVFGLVKAPPCHGAFLKSLFIAYRCRPLIEDLAAFTNCAVAYGLMEQSQTCISCLTLSRTEAVLRCFDYVKGEAINAPGLVLLSKRKVKSVKTTYFEPNVKLLLKRAYIEAEIEGVGTVYCSHLTSNDSNDIYEPNLKDVYASQAEQNLADSRKITQAARFTNKPLIIGDLNSSPAVPGSNVSADFEDSYNHFLSEGFTSPYVTSVQKCTYCVPNPLINGWQYNNMLDHVMVRNHTVLGSKRFYDQNIRGKEYPMSDHYGVAVDITD